jgi:hypothetical protein
MSSYRLSFLIPETARNSLAPCPITDTSLRHDTRLKRWHATNISVSGTSAIKSIICNPPQPDSSPHRRHARSVFVLDYRWHSHTPKINSSLYGQGIGVRFPTQATCFSLLHRIQTGSGAQPASCLVGTGPSSSGGKAAGDRGWPLAFIWCRGR